MKDKMAGPKVFFIRGSIVTTQQCTLCPDVTGPDGLTLPAREVCPSRPVPSCSPPTEPEARCSVSRQQETHFSKVFFQKIHKY